MVDDIVQYGIYTNIGINGEENPLCFWLVTDNSIFVWEDKRKVKHTSVKGTLIVYFVDELKKQDKSLYCNLINCPDAINFVTLNGKHMITHGPLPSPSSITINSLCRVIDEVSPADTHLFK